VRFSKLIALSLLATGIASSSAGYLVGGVLIHNHTQTSQNMSPAQTFQASFDQYVREDSIVGAGYVIVKDDTAPRIG